MKTRSLKSRKLDIIPKGLTHLFGIKMVIFWSCFFLRQKRPEKCVLQYSRTNKGLSTIWKQEVEKVKKKNIFPKGLTHSFGIKIAMFRTFFFLGKIGQKNVFYDIQERIKAFPGYDNKKLKQSKSWHFSKGVKPWFWYQNGHFSNFFF